MKELIEILKEKLEAVDGIQQVFMHRNALPTKYPALICVWDATDNTFESVADNMRTATFRIYITVNVAGKSMKDIDEVIIPNAYDNLSGYLDENWNFGTNVEGHRIWSVLSMAQSRISVEDKSTVAYLDCTLRIKYLKDN
jgi:hypothetical protein